MNFKDQIDILTGGVRLARLFLEERRMARDYLNLPGVLDALEDEMDLEAAAVAKAAREVQERGLSEMKRAHVAIKSKGAAIDRMKAFADNMEARNTSNSPPDKKLDPTNGVGSSMTSAGSPTSALPSETAQLGEVKGGTSAS